MYARHTLVTVAHGTDAGLLDLQARSVHRFCKRGLFDEILVVDNSAPGGPTLPQDPLRASYGDFGGRVRFIPAAHFGELPPHYAGWWTQQVRKLQVASEVRTERYVLLDAKNHLVAPLGRDFLASPDDRPLSRRYGYARHPLRPKLEHTLSFMGLDAAQHIDLFITTSTPFTMVTAHVRAAMAAHGAHSFGRFFLDNRLTEFFYYYAYLLRCGLDPTEVYSFNQLPSPLVWPHQAAEPALNAIVQEAEAMGCPVFGVHRGAVSGILADKASAARLSAFWHGRGLFRSQTVAQDFLVSIKEA